MKPHCGSIILKFICCKSTLLLDTSARMIHGTITIVPGMNISTVKKHHAMAPQN